MDLVTLGGSSLERVVSRVLLAEPGPCDEVGRGLFVGVEIAIQSQKDEAIFLRVEPASFLSVGK